MPEFKLHLLEQCLLIEILSGFLEKSICLLRCEPLRYEVVRHFVKQRSQRWYIVYHILCTAYMCETR